MKYIIVLLVFSVANYCGASDTPDKSLVTGYHFHTYFFQNNPNSYESALNFRYNFFLEFYLKN